MAKHSSIEFTFMNSINSEVFDRMINKLIIDGWNFVNKEAEVLYLRDIKEADWRFIPENKVTEIISLLIASINSGNDVGIAIYNYSISFGSTMLFRPNNNTIDFEIHADSFRMKSNDIADFTMILEVLLPILDYIDVSIESINCTYA